MTARPPKNPTPNIPRASGCAAPAGKMGNQGDLSERARVACFSASLFSRKEKNHSLGSDAEKERFFTRHAKRASAFPTTSVAFVHSRNVLRPYRATSPTQKDCRIPAAVFFHSLLVVAGALALVALAGMALAARGYLDGLQAAHAVGGVVLAAGHIAVNHLVLVGKSHCFHLPWRDESSMSPKSALYSCPVLCYTVEGV